MNIAILLLLLLQDWSYEGEGAYYKIQSTADRDKAVKVLQYMDRVFRTYRAFLNPSPSRLPKKRFTLVLYRNFGEYKKRGGRGRYGHYDGKRLVGYYDPEQMLPTFAHEGMHQFTDICIPKFRRVSPWYTEGIAECIANNNVRKKKLYMCPADGPVPKIRVPILQDAIKRKKHLPIRELFATKGRAFQKNHRICYAQSWAFCHFLLTYPKYEDKSKRIPNGKYKKCIVRYHNAMLNPKRTSKEALQIAFRGLDLDRLEREFLDWVMKWPVKYEMPPDPQAVDKD